MDRKTIYCCGCQADVFAVLITGKEAYPHRKDLHSLPFWRCPTCLNFVGCHHKTAKPTEPLGVISTPELKKAKILIHALADPLWKSGKIKRGHLYSRIKDTIGYNYHTANIKSLDEARKVYRAVREIAHSIRGN